jgi:hypothetical protein
MNSGDGLLGGRFKITVSRCRDEDAHHSKSTGILYVASILTWNDNVFPLVSWMQPATNKDRYTWVQMLAYYLKEACPSFLNRDAKEW